MKEIFKYSEHVDILTFRNYSLERFVNDQMDSRKHVSIDTIIDFFKLSGFKGVLNYDFDFNQDAEDLESLQQAVKMINAKLIAAGYKRMPREDYEKFMEFMKSNPSTSVGDYIVF